jgi:SAM-dependent methyltransferase
VLDVGCGDAYATAALWSNRRPGRVIGVDEGFTADQIRALNAARPGHVYVRRIEEVPEPPADLLLLLDVLEHVEQDAALLARLATEHLVSGGHALITVPAFQALFGDHDRYLRHLRRYSLGALDAIVAAAGLRRLDSGYLFGSLLPLRALSTALERLGLRPAGGESGVGGWHHGRLLSGVVELFLRSENDALLSLAVAGVRPPGLTIWMFCRKP